MIVEYIRYLVPPARAGEFEAAYQQAGVLLSADPHCLRYEVARGVEEPDHYIVRIEWNSIDGHLEFRASPGFSPFFAAVRPFIQQIAEMKHYQVVDPGSES